MYKLTTSFPYLLNRVGALMGELFSLKLEPYGVTLPMYRVLAALRERGDQRLSDLNQMTSIEISTLSRLVGNLKRKGLVTRTRPDTNARTVAINLTAKGRDLVDQLIPLAMHFEEVGVRSFGSAEIQGLKNALTNVYANLCDLKRDLEEAESRSSSKRSATPRRARSKRHDGGNGRSGTQRRAAL